MNSFVQFGSMRRQRSAPASQQGSGGPSLTNYGSPYNDMQQAGRPLVAPQVGPRIDARQQEANRQRLAAWRKSTAAQRKATEATDPAERAGYLYDSQAAMGALPYTRQQYIDRELAIAAPLAQLRSAQSARDAGMQSARQKAAAKFQRPDGMSDEAFQYLTGQALGNQQRWDAPTFQVWSELNSRSQYNPALASFNRGGRDIGSQAGLSAEMDLYQRETANARRAGETWPPQNVTWQPWADRLSLAPGVASREQARADYSNDIRRLLADYQAAAAPWEQQLNTIRAQTWA